MRVEAVPTQVEVMPGELVAVQLDVYNDSDIIDGYSVEVVGLDGVDATIEPKLLSLFPNNEGTISIIFAVPLRCRAGLHTLGLHVRSDIDSTVSHTCHVGMLVGRVRDAGVVLTPETVQGGRKGKFAVAAENRGNVPVEMRLRGADAEKLVRFEFVPDQLALDPGQQAVSAVRVRGPRPWLGTPAMRVLTVSADVNGQPGEEGAQLQAIGTFLQRPWVPRAVLAVAAVLALIGATAAVLLAGVGKVLDSTDQQKISSAATTTTTAVGAGGTGGAGAGAAGAGAGGAGGAGAGAGAAGVATTTTAAAPALPHAVRGQVADDEGNPIGGVAVSTPVPGQQKPATATTAATGAIGAFELPAVPPGAYTVTFAKGGYVSVIQDVTVAAEDVSGLAIVLKPLPSALVGTAFDIGNRPNAPCLRTPSCGLGGVSVTVTGGEAPLATVTATSPPGAWSVPKLKAGTYSVAFAKPGYVGQTLLVAVGPGENKVLNVALDGVPGSVSGTADTSIGACGSSSLLVRLTNGAGGVLAQTTAAADGTFSFANVTTPAKDFIVVVDATDQTKVYARYPVDLGPGEMSSGNNTDCPGKDGIL